MGAHSLHDTIEDHALARVPDAERKNWLSIAWNTAGLVTTLVILFFGALVCFVAGVKIALLAGLTTFAAGSALGWLIAGVTYKTGASNTLLTRQYGLGDRGSALASIIFGILIMGFLAVENALLYRGFIFFFGWEDSLTNKIFLYGGMFIAWVLLTTFGYSLVTRFSSLMLIGFIVVLLWIVGDILTQSGKQLRDTLVFDTQLPATALGKMGIESAWDKYIFSVNILFGPACALALNTADFGRFGKSAADVGIAACIGIFVQSIVVMLFGGVIMYAGAEAMQQYYMTSQGLAADAARQMVLRSPDSIAATFMVFGGALGFVLMLLAQTKAQVLNSYSSSLCLANLFDAVANWRPGRFTFVLLANVIALAMLYGHLLELVEAWIKLLGVLLSALSSVVIIDYYFISRRLNTTGNDAVNWAGVLSIVTAVLLAHFVLKPVQPIEVFSAVFCVAVIYPVLRLWVFRPATARH